MKDIMMIDRRTILLAGAALPITCALSAHAATQNSIHVIKGRGCGCCSAWTDILRDEGFQVSEEERLPADLTRFKLLRSIPPRLASCHTAEIDGYIIEGHVPAADIRRLIADRPDAIGLTVPGMPYGSPGMGPETEREAYDVLLLKRDGSTEIFTSYAAAN